MAKRILIVDDDRDFTDVIATRLRGIGLEVDAASNPLTAISLLEKSTPDAICLDVGMPTGDGMSVCEYLQADPRVENVPIIICTGQKG